MRPSASLRFLPFRRLAHALALLLPLGTASGARAAIGDPCDAGDVCPAGMTCIPGDEAAGTTSYCTGRCPEAGCPEGFTCRAGGGPISLCLRGEAPEVVGAGLGEACTRTDDCAPPLACFADGDTSVCSRYCTVPGTCPAGFHCVGQEAPACQPLVGPPAGLEPCADGQCAMGWDCISHPSRELAFCAWPCPEGNCGVGLSCVDGHCLPNPLPSQPAFGERCVSEGLEPTLVGCDGGAPCVLEGAQSYCTQACSLGSPCPAGYGCRRQPDGGMGECRRGVPDDEEFAPLATGDGGVVAVPEAGFAIPPPDAGGVVGGGDSGGKKGGGGCQAGGAVEPGPIAGLIAVLGALWMAARRRSPRR